MNAYLWEALTPANFVKFLSRIESEEWVLLSKYPIVTDRTPDRIFLSSDFRRSSSLYHSKSYKLTQRKSKELLHSVDVTCWLFTDVYGNGQSLTNWTSGLIKGPIMFYFEVNRCAYYRFLFPSQKFLISLMFIACGNGPVGVGQSQLARQHPQCGSYDQKSMVFQFQLEHSHQ